MQSEAGPQKDQYDMAALNEKHIVEKVLQAAGNIRERHARLADTSGKMYVVCIYETSMLKTLSVCTVCVYVCRAIKKDVGAKSFDNVILRSSSPSKIL